MGLPAPRATALHRTRQADAERYIESFNGKFRDECLNLNYFSDLADARQKIETRRVLYNCERPHQSLDYLTPAEFVTRWEHNWSEAMTRIAGPAELAGALQSVSSSVEESISLSTPAPDRGGGWGRKAISGE
jgi:hypothetical protein